MDEDVQQPWLAALEDGGHVADFCWSSLQIGRAHV